MADAGGPAVHTRQVSARRIGLISDTHFTAPDGSDVPDRVVEALRGVDLILHLGHISNPRALDRFDAVAPVLAVDTALDDRLFAEPIADEVARGRVAHRTDRIEAGGLRIGMVHDLGAGEPSIPPAAGGGLDFPDGQLDAVLQAIFGGPVDIVAYAATHVPRVLYRQGVLFVNPGSPNLPDDRPKGSAGTLAILDVNAGTATVEIVDLAAVEMAAPAADASL
jgi:putative phosphoesterase